MVTERTIQARLFKSFAKYPAHIAIECENHHITYRELDRYSSEIAYWLRAQGIAKETFIGVAVNDKITLITIILGIVKAGCVFVPLDNIYPDKRIGAMLSSSEMPYIFTGETLLEKYKIIRRQLEHRLDIFTVDESFYGPDQSFRLQRHEDKYKLSEAEKTRYKRQILIDGWGLEGQERLKASTVFVAGAGGSGSPLIQQLALCGFGTIIICDYDTVELSNLNRQSLHDESRIGMNKALSAQMTVERLNPHVNVIPLQEKITLDNVFDLVGEAEIIFDNVDSLETKSCLSQCAVSKGIPHIISSMIHINSYACIFHTPYTPCFHCLYDKKKIDDISKARTLDSHYQVIPNSVASPALYLSTGFAVNEAVKILLGFGKPAYNKYMHFNQYGAPDVVNTTGYKQITYPFNDHFRELSRKQGFDWDTGWHGSFLEEIAIEPDPQCPICSPRPQRPPLRAPRRAPLRGETINAVEPFPRSNSFPGPGDLSTPILDYFPEDKINIYFTSGTTGQPKAVLGKNEGMAHFIAWEIKEFNIDETKRVSQLTSQCHDPFLRDIFTPLCAGATICVPDSRETILDTAKMIRWLEQSKVNLVHCTPGLFKVFGGNGINPGSFPHLQYVLLAGEKIAPRDLENWYNAIGERVQLVNIYGPTETTLAKLFYRIRPADVQRDVIPIGNPIPGAKVIILNKELKICGPGEVGEIYIRTPFRSYGYYNDPTLNSEKFIKNPFGDSPGDIIYKTGDLGKWNREGHIEFVGREDRQVKIRGFRVELDEIEKRLREYPGIREAVVLFRVTGTGNQIICAYFKGEISVPELKEYFGRELPDYMAPAFYIKMETFPLNINGKIDYKALPGPGAVEREEFAAPRNEIERKMAGIWTEVLGIERIGIKDGFLDMGGNSLNAMSLTARVYKEFNVNLQLSVIFANPTVEGLISIINTSDTNMYKSIEPVEEREYYPLSSAQLRMYLLREFTGEGDISYNQPKVLILRGKIDIDRLEGAFKQLIKRHDALRTSFKNINGPVSIINEKFLEVQKGAAPPAYCTAPAFSYSESIISNCLVYMPIAGRRGQMEVDEIINSFIKPFDLSQAPLFRVGLVELAEAEHILIFDIHHIISDGVTTGIFIDEFMKLYNGEPLPDLLIQYKDYAVWQQEMLHLGPFKKQESYWLEVFKEEPPVLNLSTDFPRPAVQSYEGAHWSFTVEDRLIRRLEQVARERGATLYMALLAAYNALLYRYTGQEDIVVGSPVANRPHADLQRIPGVFINTLAMRNRPMGDQTFEQLLAAVAENAFKAYDNQDYPFEELVGKLELRRDLQRNPLFDVMFIFQNIDMKPVRLEGLTIEPYIFDTRTAKLDLSLIVLETGQGFDFSMEYSTRLFRRETVERLSRHFVKVLEAVAENNGTLLAGIEILEEEERQQLLKDFNGAEVYYPGVDTIPALFEEQAERVPDHIALVETMHELPQQLTYHELNSSSNRLAGLLREKGVGPDSIVGLMVKRSFETVIGMLGIMKAGGAYLPIDPVYPRERIDYMLKDSGVKVVVNKKFFGGLRGAVLQKSPPVNANLAYIIYTSGSTGRPKGVLLEHRNLVNLVRYQFNYTNIDFNRVLQFTTISFDVSFQEIFSTLLAGGQLYLIDEETQKDVSRLFRVVKENAICTLFLAASFLKFVIAVEEYLELLPVSVKHIVTAGEQVFLTGSFKKYLHKNKVYFHNHYGPSETHVVTTLTLGVGEEKPDIPAIGKPLVNTAIYILNSAGQLQPIGVPGELYIGGEQVGRGYLNRPGLTAEKFIKYRSYRTNRTNVIYKTGDLARWLASGNIEFLGRMDKQVKVQGFRIEPGEIECRLMEINYIKEAVVVDIEDKKGEKVLCGYVVSEKKINMSALKDSLAQRLPDYMIPTYFIQIEKIPLTPSGKVDRGALPIPEVQKEEGYLAPGNNIEEVLVEIWSEVLHIKKDIISVGANFFNLGGHSLTATLMTSRVHKEYDVKIPLAEVFRTPTIRGLADYLQAAGKERYVAIEAVEKKEYYELSFHQKRLWIIRVLNETNISYHMPARLQLDHTLDEEALKKALGKISERHESLRTRFAEKNGIPYQFIEPVSELEIPYQIMDISALAPQEREQQREKLIKEAAAMPFDLSKAPLLRVTVIKWEECRFDLLFTMHHIISDGWSMEILQREFSQLYEGYRGGKEVILEPLSLQYKDFTEYQNNRITNPVFKENALHFWQGKVAGGFPVLHLPMDIDGDKKDNTGLAYHCRVPGDILESLKQLAAANHTSLTMVMFSIFNILLAHISNQEDIVCSLISAGRDHLSLHRIVGYFTNSIIVKTHVDPEEDFNDLLLRVHADVMETFQYQGYPLELVMDELNMSYPDIAAAFNMLNIPGASAFEDNGYSQHQEKPQGAKFDLTVFVSEYKDGIGLQWHYKKALFEPGTIESIAQLYLDFLANLSQ